MGNSTFVDLCFGLQLFKKWTKQSHHRVSFSGDFDHIAIGFTIGFDYFSCLFAPNVLYAFQCYVLLVVSPLL